VIVVSRFDHTTAPRLMQKRKQAVSICDHKSGADTDGCFANVIKRGASLNKHGGCIWVRKLNDRVMKLIQKRCCFVTTSAGYVVTFLLPSWLISLCFMSPEEWNAWERHSNIICTLILCIWSSVTDILTPFSFMF